MGMLPRMYCIGFPARWKPSVRQRTITMYLSYAYHFGIIVAKRRLSKSLNGGYRSR
jgi:hypothetical protein